MKPARLKVRVKCFYWFIYFIEIVFVCETHHKDSVRKFWDFLVLFASRLRSFLSSICSVRRSRFPNQPGLFLYFLSCRTPKQIAHPTIPPKGHLGHCFVMRGEMSSSLKKGLIKFCLHQTELLWVIEDFNQHELQEPDFTVFKNFAFVLQKHHKFSWCPNNLEVNV